MKLKVKGYYAKVTYFIIFLSTFFILEEEQQFNVKIESDRRSSKKLLDTSLFSFGIE